MQIRSLFSNWSAQKRQGNLKAPEDYGNVVHSMTVMDDNNEIDAELYNNDLAEIVTECMKWKVNEWVTIVYQNGWYPGSITKVSDHTITVNVMHCTMIGKNCFKKKDEIPYIYSILI